MSPAYLIQTTQMGLWVKRERNGTIILELR
jgi:hypothetical protein